MRGAITLRDVVHVIVAVKSRTKYRRALAFQNVFVIAIVNILFFVTSFIIVIETTIPRHFIICEGSRQTLTNKQITIPKALYNLCWNIIHISIDPRHSINFLGGEGPNKHQFQYL